MWPCFCNTGGAQEEEAGAHTAPKNVCVHRLQAATKTRRAPLLRQITSRKKQSAVLERTAAVMGTPQ